MKGNKSLITKLNSLLTDELTAVNQYLFHYGVAKNNGYDKLAKYMLDRINEEREHSEILTARILFLGGEPQTDTLKIVTTSENVEEQFYNDLLLEEDAIKAYNEAVHLACESGDNATRDILAEILSDEDRHALNIEQYITQIKQMTVQNWLSTQGG